MGKEAELFKAAQNGNVEFLEKMFSAFLASNKSPPQPGRGRGKKQLSGVSLRKGATPNIQDEQGYTLLHHAALNGQCETVCLLLRCGASTTIPDCSGSSPLHLAAWKGDLEVVKVLVSQGPSRANVNHQSDTDNTPLHLAAQYGYSRVVEYLLQRHADPILHNCQGETPLDLAAQYGHLDTVHLLISHCPELLSLSRGKFSPLHLATRNGHTLVALSLINAGISVNVMGEHGTPLHEAALFGKADTVKMLLDKGARADIRDRASKTVTEALREIPAEKAREIIRMIQEHKTPETAQLEAAPHVVAVAMTSCTPTSPSSSALPYTTGDHITVVKRLSRELFEGMVNGKAGSFLARDVNFHREVRGQLIAVDSPDDIFPPPPHSPSQSHAPNRTHFPTPGPAPPIVPNKSPELRQRMSMHEPSVHLVAKGLKQRHHTVGEGLKDRHLPVPEIPAKMKKLSKKEKRFQLSKDDGSYCALSVIDPVQAAKSDAGGNLRLNPVSPALVASLPGKSEFPGGVGAAAVHNGPPAASVVGQPSDGNEEFIGSYYVLEVGNFNNDGEAREREEETVERGREREREGKSNEEDTLPPGYFMLDMAFMEERQERVNLATTTQKVRSISNVSSYENISPSTSSQSLQYQNVELKKTKAAGEYENVDSRRGHERQKSSPLGIPQPSLRGRQGEGVGGHEETRVVRRLSTSLPTKQTATGELAIERLTAAAAVATATVKMEKENEEREKERSNSHNEAMSPVTSEVKGHLPPRQRNRSRDQIYEMTSLSFPKRRAANDGPCVSGAVKMKSTNNSEKLSETETAKVNGAANGASVSMGTEEQIIDFSTDDITEIFISAARNDSQCQSEDGVAEDLDHGTQDRVREQHTQAESEREKEREEEREKEDEGGREGEREKKVEGARGGERGEREKEAEGGREGERGEREKEDEGGKEGEKGGRGKEDEGARENGVEKERESLTELIDQNGLPFAGLVMSSSSSVKATAVTAREGERGGGEEGKREVEVEPEIRPRTETIWDDCRVQKEWSQIDSLLKDMSGSIETQTLTLSFPPSLPTPPHNLRTWLSTNKMERYISNFETNGFDCLLFLGGGLLLAEDLADIGISNIEDRLTLQATAHLLPPPPSLEGVVSVSDWLESLQLSQLVDKFQGFTLRKIANMWDIELTSVVGVEILGHRRRLLYGISQLCHAHPDWSSSILPGQKRVKGKGKKGAPPTLASATPSLFRDYSSVRQLTSSLEQKSPLSPSSPIELRPPLESQNRGEVDSHSLISSSSSWRHSVASLVDETINYEAKYLGSVIIVRVRGKQSTEEACLRLRTSTESMQKLPGIILSISWKGIKFVDGASKMVVSTHSIQDISYCSQDIEERSVFAYITRDKTGMYYCHVFMATSEVIAEEILMTIGQAFEIAYQKVQRARTKQTVTTNSK